MADNI